YRVLRRRRGERGRGPRRSAGRLLDPRRRRRHHDRRRGQGGPAQGRSRGDRDLALEPPRIRHGPGRDQRDPGAISQGLPFRQALGPCAPLGRDALLGLEYTFAMPPPAITWSRPEPFGAWIRLDDATLVAVDDALAERLGVPHGHALEGAARPLELPLA